MKRDHAAGVQHRTDLRTGRPASPEWTSTPEGRNFLHRKVAETMRSATGVKGHEETNDQGIRHRAEPDRNHEPDRRPPTGRLPGGPLPFGPRDAGGDLPALRLRRGSPLAIHP